MVTGDVHGQFSRLNELISRHKKLLDLVICCGDFGYWPKQIPITVKSPVPVLWCDGNHEDHWALQNRESDEVAPNVFYMPRGSTYELDDGRTMLFMGGADSIDKQWRTLGYDWFPDELIKDADLMNLPEKKIDIFITHTCPAELVHDMLKLYPEKQYEPSNQALSSLWDIYKPELWFFGHWHQYGQGVMMGTKWYALDYPRHGSRWWMWLPEKEEN